MIGKILDQMADSPEVYDKKAAFMAQMEAIRPDLMYPESWDESKIKKANKTVNSTTAVKQMFSAIPMRCKGDKCPVRLSCDLYKDGIAPVGAKCPIELRLIRDLSEALGQSLAIDFDDFTEVSQLRVIVNQEIQLIRASSHLGEEGFIMENVVGIDDQGQPITKKELSLAVELEDKIHKRLKEYRSQLLATRQERAKITQGDLDSTKAVAKILKEIDAVNSERERLLKRELEATLNEDIVDAEIVE